MRAAHATVPAVYSVALCGGWHGLELDGTVAIALAHGIEHDPVASHPYYGTQGRPKRVATFLRGGRQPAAIPLCACSRCPFIRPHSSPTFDATAVLRDMLALAVDGKVKLAAPAAPAALPAALAVTPEPIAA
jgi:hypothetical protein